MDTAQALDVWWVFPASICFSTIALSSGISSALFFSPFFLLVVGLEPAQAVGAGLMTELFGTSFGTINYVRQRVVDFRRAGYLLIASVPTAVAGAVLAHRIDPWVLQIVLGSALLILAAIVLYHSTQKDIEPQPPDLSQAEKLTIIRARDGSVYTYRACRRGIGVALAGVGGFLTGLVSAGLPEITTTQLVLRCHIPRRVAVATAIVVLTVTAFFAAGAHAIAAEPAWYVVVWSIPGVIVAAQIGPRLAGRLPERTAERVVATLFLVVAVLVIAFPTVD